MPYVDIPYDELPQLVKDNLTLEQWREAQRGVLYDGDTVPETTDYINLKNGQIHTCQEGEHISGPALPVHDLAGGHGTDSTQFNHAPRGSRGVP
jgi:hypothetical protein